MASERLQGNPQVVFFFSWMDPKKCLWGPVLVAECRRCGGGLSYKKVQGWALELGCTIPVAEASSSGDSKLLAGTRITWSACEHSLLVSIPSASDSVGGRA